MIATYRVQLRPGFGFDELRGLLPYFRRLGISHLYLSPVTEARTGSTHGYDVTDHNRIRAELGGPEAFDRLLAAVEAHGLSVILDFVPNHEGVGPQNSRWQDVLMFGPYSRYARYFDIDWEPLKPELQHKILLPFLGSTYGEALDKDEIHLVYEDGRLSAAYHDLRFPLAPASYPQVLDRLVQLPAAGPGAARDLGALRDAYRTLDRGDQDRAAELGRQLASAVAPDSLNNALGEVRGEALHAVLERQFWRLSYWKTATHEVNYRRFFDHNDLVALQSDVPEVFHAVHQLLSRYVGRGAVEGVRVDHIDGLLDPSAYLRQLKALGTRHIWVEKILARGETLPPNWPVDGTTGYEFLNDALGVLTWPDGELPMDRIYRRFLRGAVVPYWVEAYRSKRLVMDTSLAGELFRLAYHLDRISEADYHTRDFTFEALRQALAEVIALFPRYRTYLAENRDDGEEVIRETIRAARRRNLGRDSTVYAFIEDVLLGREGGDADLPTTWVKRFEQYNAPVAAKGVEDTAFYRHYRLAALNEVGGGPDRWGVSLHAFHARARFRALRYPLSLLTTATHDHKRGAETRMRLIVLAEVPDVWRKTLRSLGRIARRYRSSAGPSRPDEYLFHQTVVALWQDGARQSLSDRMAAYMLKAAREAKLHTSWLHPDAEYEAALERFVRGVLADPRLGPALEGPAGLVARYGFANGLSQLVIKLTAPGVPDFYQGSELADLSLVDPDNRRPVDFAKRARLLEDLEPLLDAPDPQRIREMVDGLDERAKLFVMVRLLRFRQAHPNVFAGAYAALEPEGPARQHLVAYAREADGDSLVIVVPRFPAVLDGTGRWQETEIPLGERFADRTWTDAITGVPVRAGERLSVTDLPLRWAVLYGVKPGE